MPPMLPELRGTVLRAFRTGVFLHSVTCFPLSSEALALLAALLAMFCVIGSYLCALARVAGAWGDAKPNAKI